MAAANFTIKLDVERFMRDAQEAVARSFVAKAYNLSGTKQATVKRWHSEANKLPLPNWHGERCISPGGFAFVATVSRYAYSSRVTIAWELCTLKWVRVGILFRERDCPA